MPGAHVPGDTVISLLGTPLAPPPMAPASRARAEAQLAEAQAAFEREPGLEQTIWYGRRAAYLYQFARANAIYSDGIARFPEAHQLYRHRGHRYISTRQLALARADLERAAELAEGRPVELEPDGIPNRLNRPLSTGHFNIWYHLGLAAYLDGDFTGARAAYETCLRYCDNDDSLTATIDWLYMTCRRLGDDGAAARLLERITPDMELIEDSSYHRRLLLYKGLLSPEELLAPPDDADDAELALATQGYGVGNWLLAGGDREGAMAIFRRVLETTSWSAFGYIAAEAELRRASQPA
jgi:tetratricopeptide (TPR) repeat protein